MNEYPLPDYLFQDPAWKRADYAGRVEWLLNRLNEVEFTKEKQMRSLQSIVDDLESEVYQLKEHVR